MEEIQYEHTKESTHKDGHTRRAFLRSWRFDKDSYVSTHKDYYEGGTIVSEFNMEYPPVNKICTLKNVINHDITDVMEFMEEKCISKVIHAEKPSYHEMCIAEYTLPAVAVSQPIVSCDEDIMYPTRRPFITKKKLPQIVKGKKYRSWKYYVQRYKKTESVKNARAKLKLKGAVWCPISRKYVNYRRYSPKSSYVYLDGHSPVNYNQYDRIDKKGSIKFRQCTITGDIVPITHLSIRGDCYADEESDLQEYVSKISVSAYVGRIWIDGGTYSANCDGSTDRLIELNFPITSKRIRITPIEWTVRPRMNISFWTKNDTDIEEKEHVVVHKIYCPIPDKYAKTTFTGITRAPYEHENAISRKIEKRKIIRLNIESDIKEFE